MLLYQIYVHLENWRTLFPQVLDDFPAVWNYGKLSAKFLVSSIKVIDTVGFLSFFKVLLEQLLKFLLKTNPESDKRFLHWSLKLSSKKVCLLKN